MNRLYLLLTISAACLCQALAVKLDDSAIAMFTRRKIRLCLKSKFIYKMTNTVEGGEENCALICQQTAACQAFWSGVRKVTEIISTTDTGAPYHADKTEYFCNLFVFDKCSHDVNTADCSSGETWAYVRNHYGLPPGALCPADFGLRHGTSVYKLAPAKTWSDALTACSLQAGLAKFADADNLAETKHLRYVREQLAKKHGETVSFYIDARATSKTGEVWASAGCDKRFLRENWGPGQPNQISDGHLFADIWWKHSEGVDDTNPDYGNELSWGLCECVDPFNA